MNIEILKQQLKEDRALCNNGQLNSYWLSTKAKDFDFSELKGESIQEKMYLLFKGEEQFCPICGNKSKFISYSKGYLVTCSSECAKKWHSKHLTELNIKNASDKEKRKAIEEKMKQSNLKKYGVPYPNQSTLIKEKRLQTVKNKYGVENIFQLQEIKEKIRKNSIEKYGTDIPSKSEEVKNKAVKTNLEKFGVRYSLQNKEVRDKVKASYDRKTKEYEIAHNCTNMQTLIKDYGQGWLILLPKIEVIKEGKRKFIPNKYLPQIRDYSENPHNSHSSNEKEVFEYCRQLCHDAILGDKKQIAPLELDIYIPSKGVAIEYNGLYWHCSEKKEKAYHLNKTLECEKKGIRLIHIWEDLWESKQDIYKSIIASALGVYERRIYARNCECKEISSEEYRDFLDANHIQGSINSSIRLGLFYNGELVQVAGWGKSRFKKDEMELHRMCSKLNTQIIGGFSKLIKHSNLKEFISYVDRSLYDGKGYETSGFTVIGTTPPSYIYWNYKNGRVSRFQAQKKNLSRFLEKYREDLSESENMLMNGYRKIYDCGNIKVKYLI